MYVFWLAMFSPKNYHLLVASGHLNSLKCTVKNQHVVCPFSVAVKQRIYCLIRCWLIIRIATLLLNSWWFYLPRLPVSHCVPWNPGVQVQLNPFTRSVQVPLFLHGWLAQSSISVLEDKIGRKQQMTIARNKNSNSNFAHCEGILNLQ